MVLLIPLEDSDTIAGLRGFLASRGGLDQEVQLLLPEEEIERECPLVHVLVRTLDARETLLGALRIIREIADL